MARTVHHPAGDRSGAELLGMRVLDVAVHSWDLAVAIGADETIDADVVDFILALPTVLETAGRRGTFAPPIDDGSGGVPAQARLLNLLGRDPTADRPIAK